MRTLNISANGDYAFHNIYTDRPSVIVAQIITDATFDGTITLEKKALGSALGRVPALYIDDLQKQIANAVINGINKNLIVIIDSAGAEVVAKVTGWTTGTAQIDYLVLKDTFPAFKVASGGGSPTADVNVISALPPGNNNIGDVDVLSLPAISLAASLNNIGDVDVLTLPDVNLSAATLAALETIQIGSLPAVALDAATLLALETISIGTALPAGDNNIGNVDIASSVPLALDAATLLALETIELGATTLAALENINVNKQALTGSAPLQVSVGVASGELVAVNAARKGLVVVNLSLNIVSLAFGVAAELNKGITLNPSGGVWVMDEYTFSTQQIRAIAAGAGSIVAIQELT